MISQETKERIRIESIKLYPNYKGVSTQENMIQDWKQQAYIAGAEAEATRAAGLVETIEAVGKINRPEISNHTDAWQRQTQIHNLITTALTNYNNPK